MRHVAGERQLQALQHTARGRVLLAGEIEIGGAQKSVRMGIFVKGPDKDAGAAGKRRLVQSFVNKRCLAGAARGDHGDDAVGCDRGLQPVLEYLKIGRTAAEMLGWLQRVAEERLPGVGSG